MQHLSIQKRKRKITDLPFENRPREKLFAKSAKNLTEVELLAILLGTGTAKQNALVLSQSLLKQYPLRKLYGTSFPELVKFSGVGKSKAARIMAALELGERVFAPASYTKVLINTIDDLLPHLHEIAGKKQEYLLVYYLNARNELLQKEIVGQGSLNGLMITPKEIFSHALQTPCASIIVAHNHPSGDPTPSDNDIRFTSTIHEAGQVLGIPLIDHVVIAQSGYFSFRDNKLKRE